MLLLDPHLGLAEDRLDVELEAPVGHGKRIDVEVGCTVIEVKRSLATPTAITTATAQLCGYEPARTASTSAGWPLREANCPAAPSPVAVAFQGAEPWICGR